MASKTVTMSVKLRWWVWPVFWLATVPVIPFGYFVNLDGYAARLSRFIASHGVRLEIN